MDKLLLLSMFAGIFIFIYGIGELTLPILFSTGSFMGFVFMIIGLVIGFVSSFSLDRRKNIDLTLK